MIAIHTEREYGSFLTILTSIHRNGAGITMKRNEVSYQHGRINLEIMRSAPISGCFTLNQYAGCRMFIRAKAFKTDHDEIFISPEDLDKSLKIFP